jgi:hypothetical protein
VAITRDEFYIDDEDARRGFYRLRRIPTEKPAIPEADPRKAGKNRRQAMNPGGGPGKPDHDMTVPEEQD